MSAPAQRPAELGPGLEIKNDRIAELEAELNRLRDR